MPTESVNPEAKSAVDGTRACLAGWDPKGPQRCAVGLAEGKVVPAVTGALQQDLL